MKIVLASNNRGKLAELQAMFAPLVDKLPDEKLRQQVRVYLGRSIAID